MINLKSIKNIRDPATSLKLNWRDTERSILGTNFFRIICWAKQKNMNATKNIAPKTLEGVFIINLVFLLFLPPLIFYTFFPLFLSFCHIPLVLTFWNADFWTHMLFSISFPSSYCPVSSRYCPVTCVIILNLVFSLFLPPLNTFFLSDSTV